MKKRKRNPARRLLGLALEYAHWKGWRKVYGNPAPIERHHPHAPKHHPIPAHSSHPTATFAEKVVAYANAGLKFAGKMTYSEGADRGMLFHRKPGDFAGAHADCSQYVSAILHWLGVKSVTDTDYTGTLLQKGKQIASPTLGCVVIWGPGTGAHAAIYTGSGYVVGLGHQGAPDRSTLTDMNAYFQSIGKPGVRYLHFAS